MNLKMKKLSRFYVTIALSLSFLTSGLMAQTASTGVIAGKLTDVHGAAIAGRTVTSVEYASHRALTTTTNTGGAYEFALLPPGSYTIRFSVSGYATTEVRSVPVNAGDTVTVNQALTPGAQSDPIVVQWTPKESATAGTEQAAVKDIPLASRNYTQAAGLSAGVSSQVNNATAVGINTQGVQVGSGNTNNYVMDGATIATSPQGPTSPGIPNPDAIGDHMVQSWSYDAGTARFSGATIGAATKSGSDAFHGTLFEFVRNDIFNANDFFIKQEGLAKPVLKQNQFGFTFGGPFKKDKLFFFTSYQGTRQRNGYASSGFSPSVTLPPLPDIRDASHVGQALCYESHPAYANSKNNPYMTVQGGVQVDCGGSNINPVALNILNLKLPSGSYLIPGSSTGDFQTVPFSIPAKFQEDQFIFNTDYVLTPAHTLTQKFFYSRDPQISYFNFGPSSLPGNPSNQDNTQLNAVVQLTSKLKANLTNDLRVSGQHFYFAVIPVFPFTNDQVGITSVMPQVDMLDILNVQGLFTLGGNGMWNTTIANQYQAADHISWTRGRHTLRAGFEVEQRQWNNHISGDAIGQMNIMSFADFLLGLPGCPPSASNCNTANPVVNGITTNGSSFSNINSSSGPAGNAAMVTGENGITHAYRHSEYDGYLQDDFKIASRLTLNLGLRWQYFSLPSDSTGNFTNFWTSRTTAWDAPPSGEAYDGFYNGFVVPSNFKGALAAGVYQLSGRTTLPSGAPLTDFAPRFGFAWQPLKNSNTAVHGGYGLYFDRIEAAIATQESDADVPYATPVGGSGAANVQASLAQPFQPVKLGWGNPRTANFSTQSSSNLLLRLFDDRLPDPLTQKWNLEIQQQLPANWAVALGYAGAHSIHLQNSDRQLNGAVLASAEQPVNGLTTSTVANAPLRVPYLGISPSGLDAQQNQASAKYNSLLATVRKQFAHGAQVQAVYSFSKTLSDLWTGPGPGGMDSNDPLNARQQYGPSGMASPQRLAINYSWDLSYKGSGVKGKLLGDWGVSGATIIQDGTPMTLADGRGGTIYGNAGNSRAQFCSGMNAHNSGSSGSLKKRLNEYFNPSAFCAPPSIGDGTGYGNSSVGMILGPGQDNTDLSVSKSLAIRESKIELRMELFNAFNHAQFAPPDGSVPDSTFGKITSTSVNPRLIQFAMKYSF